MAFKASIQKACFFFFLNVLIIFSSFFFLLLFKYSCLHLLPTLAIPTSDLQYYPTLALSVGPLYMFLDNLSPFFPINPSHLPSGYCQFILYLTSLVLFCSLVCFVDQVPLIGEMIWYLSFTAWLTSLSLMLSRFNHAVAKGRSSFFLSAAQCNLEFKVKTKHWKIFPPQFITLSGNTS